MGNTNKKNKIGKDNIKEKMVEEELPIDGLDGRKKEKSFTEVGNDTEKKDEIFKEEPAQGDSAAALNEYIDVKAYVGGLCEDEIKSLLKAKIALEEKNQILEEKTSLLSEYEDLLKRKQAEFENYRKRVQKEMLENRKYATSEMVLDIVNIIDDFERAIGSAESSKDFTALLEGIVITKQQLLGVLEKKHGVKRIEAVGKEFDPNLHDAIMMEESEKYKEDTVVEDFQAGYVMHERVVRPTKVKVAKAVVGNIEGRSTDSSERN